MCGDMFMLQWSMLSAHRVIKNRLLTIFRGEEGGGAGLMLGNLGGQIS